MQRVPSMAARKMRRLDRQGLQNDRASAWVSLLLRPMPAWSRSLAPANQSGNTYGQIYAAGAARWAPGEVHDLESIHRLFGKLIICHKFVSLTKKYVLTC